MTAVHVFCSFHMVATPFLPSKESLTFPAWWCELAVLLVGWASPPHFGETLLSAIKHKCFSRQPHYNISSMVYHMLHKPALWACHCQLWLLLTPVSVATMTPHWKYGQEYVHVLQHRYSISKEPLLPTLPTPSWLEKNQCSPQRACQPIMLWIMVMENTENTTHYSILNSQLLAVSADFL